MIVFQSVPEWVITFTQVVIRSQRGPLIVYHNSAVSEGDGIAVVTAAGFTEGDNGGFVFPHSVFSLLTEVDLENEAEIAVSRQPDE